MRHFSWLSQEQLEDALATIITDQGVMASSGKMFSYALFGRDSLIVGLDLLDKHPELCQRIIYTLGKFQGLVHNDMREEEPGKILHEHRSLDGQPHTPELTKLFYAITKERNYGETSTYTYYGSTDATVQYIRLIAAYVKKYGPTILNEEFTRYNGVTATVKESLLDALSWVTRSIKDSSLGLLEFKRSNPSGAKWQVLRDGTLSYLHSTGDLADPTQPIASLDVQGLTYDALIEASEILPNIGQATKWVNLAEQLRLSTLKLFWLPKERYFAMSIDRDEDGLPREIKAITSMPAELLDTRFFDNLPKPYRRRTLIRHIVERLYAKDMMTSVGPRMRSLNHARLLNFADYQGSFTSWPVTTAIIARGLKKQGLHKLGNDLEQRFLTGLDKTKGYSEFFYVDEKGRLAEIVAEKSASKAVLVGTLLPESSQAWTISAALNALSHSDQSHMRDNTWEQDFTAEIFAKSPVKATQSIPTYIDQETGRNQEKQFLLKQGYEEEVKTAYWLQPAF